MPFEGFRDAIRAFGSGGAIEQQGYNAEERRLVAARSASADMDFKVGRAVRGSMQTDRERTALEHFNALVESFGLSPTDAQRAIVAGIGPGFLAGERAEGVGQQNIARGMQLENITSGDSIDVDLQNLLAQISGGRSIGPTGVQVEAQSTADIAATNALTRSRKATAAFNESKTAGIDGKNTRVTSLTSAEIDASFTSFGFIDEGQKEYNKFLAWKARKARNDPNYRDATFANMQYQLEKLEPGSSKENPLITDGTGPRPPAGTWVRTRSGRVVQVPRLDVDNQSDLTEGL